MKMTKFMASIFTASLLTLAACTNDENDSIGGSGNSQEGVKTWARLDIKVGGPVTRATTVPAAGDDGKIHNINVYVFNDAGQFEATTDIATPEDSHNTVHSTTLALTSGRKKVYVVANLDPAWMPANVPATQTAFEALFHELCETPGRRNPAVTRVGDSFSDLTGGEDGSKGVLMSNVLTGVYFTLNPGVSKEQASQASYDDPTAMEQNNHLQVSLFRAPAKIQVSYDDADVLTINSVTAGKPIAKLDPASLRFAIRNLPKSTYMFLHNRENGFLTPHYAFTNVNSSEADFAAIFDDADPIDQQVKLESENPVSVYVPENANQTPMVGNTTYAIIKATLRPMKNVMINNIRVTGKAPDFVATEEYDDTDYSTNTEVIPPFFTANNKIFTLPKNISMTDDERREYGFSLLLKDYLASNGKSPFLKTTESDPANEGDVQNQKWVYYTCEADVPQGIYQIAKIRKHVKNNDTGIFYPEEVADIRFLQYVDGAVHYRINIEDNEDGKTDSNNLYYSVMRNRFYKVKIRSVSAIGTASEDGSSSVDPTDPVNSKTYMQAHITVVPWTVVSQDADLGI